jgi:hypothetical protein
MLLSVVVVDDCRVGSLKSTSRLPVVSVRAYRACDSSACLPRAIIDGMLGCWFALVQYVWALWPVDGALCSSSRPRICLLVVVLIQFVLRLLLTRVPAGGYLPTVNSDLTGLVIRMCVFD